MMVPLTLRERIILVFTNRDREGYSTILPTWVIRESLGNSHTCDEIRKELLGLEKDGYLHKDLRGSRRGQAEWRWDK